MYTPSQVLKGLRDAGATPGELRRQHWRADSGDLDGHPSRRHVPELTAIPWLVTERGPRRDIRAGAVRSQAGHYAAATDSDATANRLADLGYLEQ